MSTEEATKQVEAEGNPRPVVICGPSGVGKGTLIEKLFQHFPNNQFGFSVSHTTRKPRTGEEDGVHYNFSTVETMKKEIEDGKFIESAEVHGNYYGTSVAAVESVQKAGKICVLDIDVQGAQSVKKSALNPIYIFIAPPSMEALESRLRGRGTEDEASIKKRLGNASKELEYGQEQGNFDRIFTNDNLNTTFEELVAAFKSWYPHLREVFRPRPVVFCGPSGVGKGTLIDMLMKRFPNDQFGFSVSHTTRKPREGEKDGVHYNFTNVDSMKKEIDEGKFVESAEVHGNYYGTSIAAVETVQNAGKICILDIDVQGVRNVKKSSLKPLYLFIAPPSVEELEKRLRGRGTETEESIQKRLGNASKELEYGQQAGNFDRVFVNADLKSTFEDMVMSFHEWFPQLVEYASDDVQKSCQPSCVVS
mmetsp:Transcript_30630/g.47005  ORF Transcript_30630/g.47005 Transcript_30630/m.47005 type:complete len:420 (-) Transcript_30630:173-1432(-)|eukprot:CAMPEP_0195304242 /NCGR_PEP_ID=MMETSP0707-20130614/34120_1 /TAXON_ID=33640 /ORGANISM="Asterionellopsis glacialis, Strain CCMP134" /LENGTH=419 /DNA_ID=CAMNT_0040368001 /DNA_START=128 /DNA_END=1387 /DNA_ORIENTATION=+